MDLYPTADQSEIIESVNSYLANELPATRLPNFTGTALSPREWRDMAAMGWFGLGLAEEAGGLGLSLVEEALVVREFGRHLIPPSALATMLAVHVAAAVGDAALAAGLSDGTQRAAFAVPDASGGWNLLDSDGADIFLAWLPDRALLIPLSGLEGFEIRPSFDASLQTGFASAIDEAAALIVADQGGEFTRRARVLVAAALTGGAEAVRDLSSEYAKVRHQFGRPIGEFQAISHRCAAMAVNSEAALSILQYAAVSTRDLSHEADMYSAAAVIVAQNAAYSAAADSMQIHGGYGQTYEYLPHFYLKRAILYRLLASGETLQSAVLDAESTI